MSTTDSVQDEVETAASAILDVLSSQPDKKLDASDIVAALRARSLRETAARRAIWRLVASGDLDLDDELHVVVTQR